MPRSVVTMLWDACNGVDTFTQRLDSFTEILGIRPLVRFVGALWMIKYGDCSYRLDEHLQISQSVRNESMKAFCKVFVSDFLNGYLNRSPTPA